jgi:hypothetical protein
MAKAKQTKNKHLSKEEASALSNDLIKTFSKHGICRMQWMIAIPSDDNESYTLLNRVISITMPERLTFLSTMIREAKENLTETTKQLGEGSIEIGTSSQ